MSARDAHRLLLVSNRLPVKLRGGDGVPWSLERTMGGLATGLAGPHRDSGGVWIGWPGLATEDGSVPVEAEALLRADGFHPIGLTPDEHERYYLRASNRCIWPLLHGFVERVEFDRDDWRTYRAVNQRFADAVVEEARPGDVVFVQDFQLMLVPAMIRAQRDDLRIGFFLHVPFPHTGIFRALPSRLETLTGLLGADVIGFHTLEYLRCFRSAARRVLGVETTSHSVDFGGRRVSLVAQPLGIDPTPWERPSDEPDVAAALAEAREAADGRRVLLGVERLDYTKGILERLRAFKEMLEEEPSLAEEVVFFQIAVPSRVEVDAYRELQEEAARLAGEINSRFGRVGLQPLHYQLRGVGPDQLLALYRVADVCVVTPLRDGLNLVAKEFVASRLSNGGVLVLSEFTGASWELTEALHVNPYDIDAMKTAFRRALAMDEDEQARRMAPMRERIQRDDIHRWTASMLGEIEGSVRSAAPVRIEGELREALDARWAEATDRVVALDYDGTLRELVVDPEAAVPSEELTSLLTALAATPGVEPWIVSGRTHEFLSKHLGGTGVGFIAEHGRCAQWPGDDEVRSLLPSPAPVWKERVRPLLEDVCGRVQGSHIEEKPQGLAWHYRAAEPESAAWQAHELYQHLGEILADENLEVLRGSKVLEVRPSGVSKSRGLGLVLHDRAQSPDLLVVAGDDVTDESMFREFEDAVSILVGTRASAADHRVDTPADLRALLADWAEAARSTAGGHRS